ASRRKYILRSSQVSASPLSSGATPPPPSTRPPRSSTKYALRGAEYARVIQSTSGSLIAKPLPQAPNSGITVRMIAAMAASSSARIGRIDQSCMRCPASGDGDGEGRCAGLPQPVGVALRRQPRREQEALADLDPELEQEPALRLILHALGDQRQPEAAGDAAHRLAHRDVGAVGGHG